MQEKLTKVKPRTIGQASRIPGVTPAAVSLVNVFIEIQGKETLHHPPIRSLPDVVTKNLLFSTTQRQIHSSAFPSITILLLPVKTAVMRSHPVSNKTVVCRPLKPGRLVNGVFRLHSLSFLSAAARKSMVGGGRSPGLRQTLSRLE